MKIDSVEFGQRVTVTLAQCSLEALVIGYTRRHDGTIQYALLIPDSRLVLDTIDVNELRTIVEHLDTKIVYSNKVRWFRLFDVDAYFVNVERQANDDLIRLLGYASDVPYQTINAVQWGVMITALISVAAVITVILTI